MLIIIKSIFIIIAKFPCEPKSLNIKGKTKVLIKNKYESYLNIYMFT